jgi:2-polyprenyl-3-methyl-5-hydroxy-6-metoxy-1,4-benzoquinol methylase
MDLNCPSLPIPSREIVRKAANYFSNSFSVSTNLGMTREEIEKKIKSYFWHYPFEFDGLFVDASLPAFARTQGRHYQRYMHIFPAILSMTDDSSLSGNTVLDIACNCGFWSIQANLAGADTVIGVEASPKNVEQANFILQLTGLNDIKYRVMNAYDVSTKTLGEFDITFFFGLLYHLDKPIVALERLYEVTKKFAVIDTSLAISKIPMLRIREDTVHDQNFSNRLALVPSEGAVPLILRYIGFREVFCLQNISDNLPRDYVIGARKTFIAVK